VHNAAHLGSGFPDVMDYSKLWRGMYRTAWKAEQLHNSLLEIDGLQVGVSSSIACHTSCIVNQWLCRYNMPRSLSNVQCCLKKVGVLVMLKRRKSNVPLCSNLMEVMGFFQVGTRWMSDERVKETHPLRKFRKILL
jgi:hypothetical protein